MGYEEIEVHVSEGVGRIVFNRPEVLNAYNERMSGEILRGVEALSEDAGVRVVVLTGKGRAFMAGADLNMLKAWTAAPGGGEEVAGILSHFFTPNLLERCPKPVIAAVNGLALGMGCEIALACDLRIAAQSARFGQPEINLGIMTGAGGSQRLPRLVGSGRAMEMILTGQPIDAEEARRWGLVNRVVQDEELAQTVDDMARKLAAKSATALRCSKEAVIAARNMGLYEGVAYELRLFSGLFETPDAREGIAAFLEKRRPKFQ